jgi:Ca-activated chloride channel family protein
MLTFLKTTAVLAVSLSISGPAVGSPPRDDDDEPAPKMKMRYSFDAAPLAAESIGVTQGGAQDIGYARDRIKAGEIPHPNTFTPEGLFSEHDLPIKLDGKCRKPICVGGQGIQAELIAQPEVRYLAQLGFGSNISAKTFKRKPLNLIAVVDTSGSMSGQPHELVRDSLMAVLDQLGPDDQIGVVLYDSKAHVALRPTPVRHKRQIKAGIAKIQSGGSTAMEEGLQLGFELARKSARSFEGTSRVMLFTDERPNVGRTDAGSFMGMAEKNSRKGIGLTTVGVSTHFGAELATKISSVRGGNLFFFPSVEKMLDVFEEDFETMVTELAYDVKLTVSPNKGMKIAGVYGIPGEALEWQKNGSIELGVATLFASKRDGGIYIAYAPEGPGSLPASKVPLGSGLGRVAINYEAQGKQWSDRATMTRVGPKSADVGLRRGHLLVNQVTALKKASELHHVNNDQEGAYRLVHAVAAMYKRNHDATLAPERETVGHLLRTLTRLSGHKGEGSGTSSRDTVSGLPHRPRTID